MATVPIGIEHIGTLGTTQAAFHVDNALPRESPAPVLAWATPTARKGRTKTFGPWNPLTVTLKDVENRSLWSTQIEPSPQVWPGRFQPLAADQ